MPTSDNQWQRWQPDDLSGMYLHDEPALIVAGTSGAGGMEEDTARQAELSRIRQQAEQAGFSRGQEKGYEEGKKQGYEDGHKRGYEAGLKQGENEQEARQQLILMQYSRLLESFQDAIDSLDRIVAPRLVQLALAAARSVIGDAISSENYGSVLLTYVRQQIAEDSLLRGQIKLLVSQDEPGHIRARLEELIAHHGWEMMTDARLLPGGCRIISDEAELDASLETRWQMLCQLSREETGI